MKTSPFTSLISTCSTGDIVGVAATYYVVCESLANVGKHARAGSRRWTSSGSESRRVLAVLLFLRS